MCKLDSTFQKELPILIGILLFFLIVPEVFAFSRPIVDKGTHAMNHIISILNVGVGIAFCYFIFTLLTSRPNWILLICILVAGACLFSFQTDIFPWFKRAGN